MPSDAEEAKRTRTHYKSIQPIVCFTQYKREGDIAQMTLEDIYIISAFDIEMPEVIDANHTMIMLCSEY